MGHVLECVGSLEKSESEAGNVPSFRVRKQIDTVVGSQALAQLRIADASGSVELLALAGPRARSVQLEIRWILNEWV